MEGVVTQGTVNFKTVCSSGVNLWNQRSYVLPKYLSVRYCHWEREMEIKEWCHTCQKSSESNRVNNIEISC